MYEDFYGFAQSPFSLAPDPKFLFLSSTHDGAIRRLFQAIRRREGFIVLAGDIGTGKTTLCRALIEQLDESTFTSLVLNPFVSIEELVKEVLLDFGVVSRDAVKSGRLATATRHELISTLHEFLLSLQPLGGVAVLIIDEAQHLSPEVLEQIRIISNLETNQAKLMQIVLVGQLNLLETLGSGTMKQLDQRVSLRAMLTPLTRVEIEAYIGHRIGVARGTATVTFDAPALDVIHAITGGVPRIINLLCDRALMLGAEAGTGVIGADLARRAALALGLAAAPRASRVRMPAMPRWLLVTVAAVLLLVAALTAVLFAVPAETMVPAPSPAHPASPPPPRFGAIAPAWPVPEVTPPLYPLPPPPVAPPAPTPALP